MPDDTLSPRMRWGLGLWIAATAIYYYLNFSAAFYHANQSSIDGLFK